MFLVLSLNKAFFGESTKCFYSALCSYIFTPYFLTPFNPNKKKKKEDGFNEIKNSKRCVYKTNKIHLDFICHFLPALKEVI